MVGVVNSHFGRALRAMGCAGEVSLFCGCDAGFDACNAFDKYAVHIRVRFRCGLSLSLEQGSSDRAPSGDFSNDSAAKGRRFVKYEPFWNTCPLPYCMFNWSEAVCEE
jgi:hypothetical protein